MEIAPAPQGLESARTLLFSGDCLEFLVKLVDAFDAKIDEVRENKTNLANKNKTLSACTNLRATLFVHCQKKRIKKDIHFLFLLCV